MLCGLEVLCIEYAVFSILTFLIERNKEDSNYPQGNFLTDNFLGTNRSEESYPRDNWLRVTIWQKIIPFILCQV